VLPVNRAVDAPGPLDRLGFRRDVQGLRAVAVVLVVVFHSGLAPRGGFLGVDVFFVISGFVIGRLLLAEQAQHGRIALGRFYARRVRRLLPALAVVLVFVALVSLLVLSPLGTTRETTKNTGIGAALYLANFAILRYQTVGYFDLGAANNPLLHTWTLGVEEQFYLFFPLLLIVLAALAGRGLRRRRRVIVIGVVFAAIASFVIGASMTGSFGDGGPFGSHGRLAFYASPTRAWEFLAGVLVVFAEPHVRRMGRGLSAVIAVVGLAAIGGAAWFVSGSDSTLGPSTLVPVLGAALVIVAGTGGSVVSERVLSARPMVWLGDRSYGFYLWHWPLMVFARLSFPTMSDWALLAVGIAALVPTMISYRFVEQPIRHRQTWLGWRAVATGVVCSAAAIVLFVVMVALPPLGEAQAAPLRAALEHPSPPPTQCYRSDPTSDVKTRSACLWRTPDDKGKVVVVGDSHAWAINDGMVDAALDAGYGENLIFRSGCPFADVIRVVDEPVLQRACRDFVTSKVEAIERERPALVVLVSNQNQYIHSDDYTLRDPLTGRTGRDEATRARIWRDGLTRTLQRFARRGIPTVVVSSVPHLDPFKNRLCPAWRRVTDPVGCARTVSRDRVEAVQRAGRAATRKAVQAVPGSHIVDFDDVLCPAATCSTYRDGKWIYRDETHLSPLGATLLVPEIERSVIAHARGADSGPSTRSR
jgi:peptidoglycan/LPS O-acetylase OafA/YrhL